MEQPTIESYIKRANIYLEDKEWEKADQYFEKTLDVHPECADAYLGKLLVELNYSSFEELFSCEKDFLKNPHFEKAIKYSDDSLKIKLLNLMNEVRHQQAVKLIEQAQDFKRCGYLEGIFVEKFVLAIEILSELDDFKNSKQLKKQCIESIEEAAEEALRKELYYTAMDFFAYISRFKNVDEKIEKCESEKNKFDSLRERISVRMARKTISASAYHTVAIKKDGKLYATKYDRKDKARCTYYTNQCEVSGSLWKDIVAVSTNTKHTVALKLDGTVIATKPFNKGLYTKWKEENSGKYKANVYDGQIIYEPIKERVWDGEEFDLDYCGQCEVGDWKDIIAISAGEYHTVGIKKDKTVVSTKFIGQKNLNSGQTEVGDWQDIVQIIANTYETVGLKADGNVICTKNQRVKHWKDFVAIIKTESGSICGLRTDGSLICEVLCNDLTIKGKKIEGNWNSAIELLILRGGIVALNKEGEITTDNNESFDLLNSVSNIASIDCNARFLVLKKDGTVSFLTLPHALKNYDVGQYNVSRWRDIAQPTESQTFDELFEEELKIKIARNKKDEEKAEAVRIAKEKKKIAEQKAAEEKAKQEKEAQLRKIHREKGVCQHCGGTFKGLFSKTCSCCGIKKDY